MNEFKRYPEDRKNQGTLGIKLPANGNDSGSNTTLFNMSYSTEEQAVSNFVNLLLTRSGERYMQPEFGVGLMYYIFEANAESVLSTIETSIEMQAAQWLPYIRISDVSVNGNKLTGDGHTVAINITFKVTEFGANKQLSIFAVDGKPTFTLIEAQG